MPTWVWLTIIGAESVMVLLLWQRLWLVQNLARWLITHRLADLEYEAALWEERARHLGWRDK